MNGDVLTIHNAAQAKVLHTARSTSVDKTYYYNIASRESNAFTDQVVLYQDQ